MNHNINIDSFFHLFFLSSSLFSDTIRTPASLYVDCTLAYQLKAGALGSGADAFGSEADAFGSKTDHLI